MYIKVEELVDLCEQYPELHIIRDVTANHGEESEISKLCEVIAHLYKRLDSLQSRPTTNVKPIKTEK
jgi:hypothetical protein